MLKVFVKGNADISAKAKEGNSVLHLLARRHRPELDTSDNYEAISYFLKLGLDPNSQNKLGDTPLHVAKSSAVDKLLVSNGADDSTANNKGGKLSDLSSLIGNPRTQGSGKRDAALKVYTIRVSS